MIFMSRNILAKNPLFFVNYYILLIFFFAINNKKKWAKWAGFFLDIKIGQKIRFLGHFLTFFG